MAAALFHILWLRIAVYLLCIKIIQARGLLECFNLLYEEGFKTLLTLFSVITIVFFLTRITGNPFEREFQDTGITEEQKQELMEYYGFDKPLGIQYLVYLRELFLHGNAGKSMVRGDSVTTLYFEAFLMTGKLVIWCFLIGPIIGIPLGMIGAIKRNTALGQGAMALAFIGYAFPNFVYSNWPYSFFQLYTGMAPKSGGCNPGTLYYAYYKPIN